MNVNRKSTAWRKNRKLGDVYGGRRWPLISDKIFRRLHSLQPAAPGQELPILIEENPSRDFFFPITANEALEVLRSLPAEQTEGITHLWLRKLKKSDYYKDNVNFAEYICGSRVRAVILYPWPISRQLSFGKKRPPSKLLKEYSKWTTDLIFENDKWILRWTDQALKRFYAENLLLHEIGHHVDQSRRLWSKANTKQLEEFANQYAVQWSQYAVKVFEQT